MKEIKWGSTCKVFHWAQCPTQKELNNLYLLSTRIQCNQTRERGRMKNRSIFTSLSMSLRASQIHTFERISGAKYNACLVHVINLREMARSVVPKVNAKGPQHVMVNSEGKYQSILNFKRSNKTNSPDITQTTYPEAIHSFHIILHYIPDYDGLPLQSWLFISGCDKKEVT